MTGALLANLAATLFLTGLAWSMALVQLPILLRGDYPELGLQLALHRRLNSRLMVAPMAIEIVTAVWLVIDPPPGASWVLPELAAALVGVIGYATVRYSLLHPRIQGTYNKPVMDSMRMWNVVRTGCWTARSALVLWLVARRFC